MPESLFISMPNLLIFGEKCVILSYVSICKVMGRVRELKQMTVKTIQFYNAGHCQSNKRKKEHKKDKWRM